MSFAEDLLDVATSLANMDRESPRQATLRRAVSTAYYALFHLLISEATLNWSQPQLRSLLGRVFEHGKMKQASESRVSALKMTLKQAREDNAGLTVPRNLLVVARAFVQAHQLREAADYNTSKEWTRTDATNQIDSVSEAFQSWQIIRHEPDAQAYLVSLLSPRSNS